MLDQDTPAEVLLDRRNNRELHRVLLSLQQDTGDSYVGAYERFQRYAVGVTLGEALGRCGVRSLESFGEHLRALDAAAEPESGSEGRTERHSLRRGPLVELDSPFVFRHQQKGCGE